MRQNIIVLNNTFEDGWYNWGDIGELTVARHWVPWWREGNQPGQLHRPEFAPELKRFKGQKLFTTFATHDGGLFQRVAIPDGASAFELAVACQYWSKHMDGSGGGLAMRCGLDPTAGSDPSATSIVWGDWHGQDDKPPWDGSTTRTIQAALPRLPDGNRWVTVWIESRCRFAAKHNDAYFDHVTLTAEVGSVPEPEGDLLTVLRSIDAQLAGIRQIMEERL